MAPLQFSAQDLQLFQEITEDPSRLDGLYRELASSLQEFTEEAADAARLSALRSQLAV